jgi:hypothetical protein
MSDRPERCILIRLRLNPSTAPSHLLRPANHACPQRASALAPGAMQRKTPHIHRGRVSIGFTDSDGNEVHDQDDVFRCKTESLCVFGQVGDCATLAARIRQMAPDLAIVERVASMPGQGVAEYL